MEAAVYALYKGDTFLTLGTMPELVEETGITEGSLRYLSTPRYRRVIEEKGYTKNSKVLIRIEEGE